MGEEDVVFAAALTVAVGVMALLRSELLGVIAGGATLWAGAEALARREAR